MWMKVGFDDLRGFFFPSLMILRLWVINTTLKEASRTSTLNLTFMTFRYFPYFFPPVFPHHTELCYLYPFPPSLWMLDRIHDEINSVYIAGVYSAAWNMAQKSFVCPETSDEPLGSFKITFEMFFHPNEWNSKNNRCCRICSHCSFLLLQMLLEMLIDL